MVVTIKFSVILFSSLPVLSATEKNIWKEKSLFMYRGDKWIALAGQRWIEIEIRIFSTNVYSLQMTEFSYSSFVKKQHSGVEIRVLCVRGLNWKPIQLSESEKTPVPTKCCREADFNVSGIVKVSEQMRVDGNSSLDCEKTIHIW